MKKNTLLVGLSLLASTSATPSWLSQESKNEHTLAVEQNISPKKDNATSTFILENFSDTVNKDSLTAIIDRDLNAVKKKLEQDFLQKKYKEFSKLLTKELSDFQNDQIFSKEKNETLSDEKLQMFIDQIAKVKTLADLSLVCKAIVSYIEDIANKKDVALDSKKVIKSEKTTDPAFISKLDDRKNKFAGLNKAIETTKVNANSFENINDNPESANYAKDLDSLTQELSSQQTNLISLQDALEKTYNTLNGENEKKAQAEVDLKTQDIKYAEFKNTITTDNTLLAQKHAIETEMQKLTSDITRFETSISTLKDSIAQSETKTIPSKKKEIEQLYKTYATTLQSYITAVRNQYNAIMIEKNNDITTGINNFKEEEKHIATSIDSLLSAHKTVVENINSQKEKSDSMQVVLAKFQAEETVLSKNIEEKNEALIANKISLGFKFQESYDIYIQRLNKEKSKQVAYRDMYQKQLPNLEKDVNTMKTTVEKNNESIKALSSSSDSKDIKNAQKKVHENKILLKKIEEKTKEINEKKALAANVQIEIDNIEKVTQYMENNKDLAEIAKKMYLSSKKIETHTLNLATTQETKSTYDWLLAITTKQLTTINKELAATDELITNAKNQAQIDVDQFKVLLDRKDTLLIFKQWCEKNIALLNEKITKKQTEITKLVNVIDSWKTILAENQQKWNGFKYNRQSFAVDNNKYYVKELIHQPDLLLTPAENTSPKQK